jgi:4-hydroxybenzoate polyprenyltransferase
MTKPPTKPQRNSPTLQRTTGFWQQVSAFIKELFTVLLDQLKCVFRPFLLSLKFIVKQANKFIDYLAMHPLLDLLEHGVKKSPINLRQSTASIKQQITLFKQSKFYQKAGLYAQLIRLDKPIGILLLLWPTLIALWIAAEGWPDPLVLFVFVMGVILMRSAGCAINDYADRKIDSKVKRTEQRPLASGKITKKEALAVFATLSLLAFLLVLLMNTLTIIMSLVGVFLAVSYPFMKRYHYLPQVHLGAAFGWAAPMAYAAQANEVTTVTWLIFLATILWATAYDTMYAMVDYDDDIKIGVKSTAILFGNQDRLIIGLIQILLILNLILIGHRAELSGFYYLGVAAAAMFAVYQQYLIKDRERELCFKAFLNNNWFGLVLFIGVFMDYQFAAIQ